MSGGLRLLTLYGLPGCHLCEQMRASVDGLRHEFAFGLEEVSIDRDPALHERFGADIPVLADGDTELCRHFFDAAAVRAHLTKFPRLDGGIGAAIASAPNLGGAMKRSDALLTTRRQAWGLVIFDCDGVLVDSEPIASRVLAQVVSEQCFPLTAQQAIERFTGLSLATVLSSIEAQWGRSLPLDFRERLRERDYAAFRAELKPIEGTAEVLERLSVARCVASSGVLEKIRLTLGTTGLLHYFEPHLFSAQMVAHGKPAPDLFLFAAERMEVAPQDCVVVEDSVAGIQAARAANMVPVGFAGGGHAGPGYAQMLREAGATVVIERMAELPQLLTY